MSRNPIARHAWKQNKPKVIPDKREEERVKEAEREVDLFGEPLPYKHPLEGARGRNPKPRGYAARPGSGPQGETCKTCDHYCHVKNGGARHYRKCGVIQWRWTHSSSTDIKASSPACSYWQPQGEGHD